MNRILTVILASLVLNFNASARVAKCNEARAIHSGSSVNYSTGKEICAIPKDLKQDPARAKDIKEYLNSHCVVMVPGFIYSKERFDYYNPFSSEFWRDMVGWGKKDMPVPFKKHFKKMTGRAGKGRYFEVRDVKTNMWLQSKIYPIKDVSKALLAKMKDLKKNNPKCANGFLLFGHSKGGATIQQLLNAGSKKDQRWLADNVAGGAVISPTINGSPLADLVLGQARKQSNPNYALNRSEKRANRIFKHMKNEAKSTNNKELKLSISEIEAAIKATKKGLAKVEKAFSSITTSAAKTRNYNNSNRYQVFSSRKSPIANVTLSTTNPLEKSQFLSRVRPGLNDRLSRLVDQIEKRNKVLKNTSHVCEMGHRANNRGKQCTFGLMFHAVEAAMTASGVSPQLSDQPSRRMLTLPGLN